MKTGNSVIYRFSEDEWDMVLKIWKAFSHKLPIPMRIDIGATINSISMTRIVLNKNELLSIIRVLQLADIKVYAESKVEIDKTVPKPFIVNKEEFGSLVSLISVLEQKQSEINKQSCVDKLDEHKRALLRG